MPRKSHILRSLVKRFVARSRGMRHSGMGLGLAGGRRRYRKVGGAVRRTVGMYHAPSAVKVPGVIRRNPKKSAAAALAGAAGLAAGAYKLYKHLGYGRRHHGRRHHGGALHLAGYHGPVHVGVSKMGLTNLPQAY